MRIIGIEESDGVSRWEVMVEASDGEPLKIRSAHPAKRGSFLEAALNTALAFHNVKRAFRLLLPAWLLRFVPKPKKFWTEIVL